MPNNKGQIIIAESGNDIAQLSYSSIFSDTFTRADGAPANNWTVTRTYLSSSGGGAGDFAISSYELTTYAYANSNKVTTFENWISRNNEFGSFVPTYKLNFSYKPYSSTNSSLFIGMGCGVTSRHTGVQFSQVVYLPQYALESSVRLDLQFYNNGSVVSTGTIYLGVYDSSYSYAGEITFATDKITVAFNVGNSVEYATAYTYPSNYLVFGWYSSVSNGQSNRIYLDNIEVSQLI